MSAENSTSSTDEGQGGAADADPTLELVRLAREFYPVEADAQDDGFYFFCGGIFVAPATLVEVTEDEYAVLKRYC